MSSLFLCCDVCKGGAKVGRNGSALGIARFRGCSGFEIFWPIGAFRNFRKFEISMGWQIVCGDGAEALLQGSLFRRATALFQCFEHALVAGYP